jgi:hypothetical protein
MSDRRVRERDHRIEQQPDGKGALLTHYGYVLFTAATRAEVEQYYRRHCMP